MRSGVRSEIESFLNIGANPDREQLCPLPKLILAVTTALTEGVDRENILIWLTLHRPAKDESYAPRTLLAAERFIDGLPTPQR